MLALIKKTRNDAVCISGYCGTPVDIVQHFLDSGVRDLYQKVWMQSVGGAGDAARILNELLGKSNSGHVTRQDIEGIDFCLGNWKFECFSCAETREEAATLCDLLDAENAGVECSSSFRGKQYAKLMEALKNRYPDISDTEMKKLLSATMNLKL